MATVVIESFPYLFTSTGTQEDTILVRNNPVLILTAFPKITSAGTLQFSVGGAVTATNPTFDTDDTIPPIIFGGQFGELRVKASGASVTCTISFA